MSPRSSRTSFSRFKLLSWPVYTNSFFFPSPSLYRLSLHQLPLTNHLTPYIITNGWNERGVELSFFFPSPQVPSNYLFLEIRTTIDRSLLPLPRFSISRGKNSANSLDYSIHLGPDYSIFPSWSRINLVRRKFGQLAIIPQTRKGNEDGKEEMEMFSSENGGIRG